MGPWTLLLLLLLPLALCVSLPAPSNVSISSYNMEHLLSFSPGPQTPPDARFTVQMCSSRKQRWKAVAGCAALAAGQTCNLTGALTDVLERYAGRVRASRGNQSSQWSTSKEFSPLSDTVLGAPEFSVSGCGNCLILQIRDAPWSLQLRSLHWELELSVRRTRDGAEFKLKLPYRAESVISYLQPGAEYCVSASVSLTSSTLLSSVSMGRRCAFTGPAAGQHTLFLVLGVLGALTLLAVLVAGRLFFRSKVKHQHLPCLRFRSQPYSCLMTSLMEDHPATA